ncbi:hypothetical protein RCL1_005255 [Eukaryota sp. TZLM3-RCL]
MSTEAIPGALTEKPQLSTTEWRQTAKESAAQQDFKYCFINGEIKESSEFVQANDTAITMGAGCYETFLCLDGGKIWEGREHCDRFFATCEALGFPLPIDQNTLLSSIRDLVSRNRASRCLVRCLASPGAYANSLVESPELLTPTLMIQCLPLNFMSAEQLREGIVLASVEEDRWTRSDLKSTSLLPNFMALRAAKQSLCDDAIFVTNEGNIQQCSFSNIFCLIKGELHTPAAGPHTGVVPGRMRRLVLDVAEEMGIPVIDDEPISLWNASRADECFCTSTRNLIVPVSAIDGTPIKVGQLSFTLLQKICERIEAETGSKLFESLKRDIEQLEQREFVGIGL